MYYFIVNPGSRSGRGKAVWQIVEGILEREQVEYRVFFTTYRYHATKLAREITSQKEKLTLVTVGGDGTVNEVVDGIQDFSKVTFGYIPTGSSNDFARSLRLPSAPEAALYNILHPSYFQRIDLGLITYGSWTRRFAGSCGCGFDAAVCQRLNASRFKRLLCRVRLTKLSYVAIGLQSLFQLRTVSGRLTLDGIKKIPLKDVAFLSTHVQKFEGGGFKFAPKADPCDGQFDVCVFSHASRLRMIPPLLLSFAGFHTRCNIVRIYRCKELSIHMDTPCAVHADGEVLGVHSDVTLSCRTRQLRVIV